MLRRVLTRLVHTTRQQLWSGNPRRRAWILLSSVATASLSVAVLPTIKGTVEHGEETQKKSPRTYSNGPQSWHFNRFLSFASFDYNGEAYMTPLDFVKCASGVAEPYPLSNLRIAFLMFDRDNNEQVDLDEFKKIINIVAGFSIGDQKTSNNEQATTLTQHLFGQYGKKKLKFEDFSNFVVHLQTEVLKVQFNHLATSQSTVSPLELGRSLLHYTNMTSTIIHDRLSRLKNDDSLADKSINFEAYKDLFNFIYVLDDFSGALQMFRIAHHNISKSEFQRAVRAVTGSQLNSVVVDTLFALFDDNRDGQLSYVELVDAIRAHGLSSRHPPDPRLQFAYWPRYVARLLRFRAVYRKELLGWRMQSEVRFQRPDRKPNEYREDSYLPVWHFSDSSPWNVANRVSQFPYPNLTWCVVQPDGKKVAKKLPPLLPNEQLIFKGDRVKVLIGPDHGKVGTISAILKMRRRVIVEGLNYRVITVGSKDLRREEQSLCMKTEIALLDPTDNEPCLPVWRFTEKGKQVRVSARTGHLIPLPTLARQLDDMTDPQTAVRGPKDTEQSVANQVTFQPRPSEPVSFEADLSQQYGLTTSKEKPCPTYWY